MKTTQTIDTISIKYKNDEKAKNNFLNLILDYLLDHHLLEKDDMNE